MTYHIFVLTNHLILEFIIMNLHAMGLNMEHESSFIIDRPFGSGDNLFLIFKTEASICNEGQWTSVPSGSFILYTKGMPQKYKASSKKYINHYIHFGRLKDEFIRETGIITNSPCFLNNLEEIENCYCC